MEPEIPHLLTVKEIALILGLHEKVVYRFVKLGIFDDCVVRIGNTKLVRFNSQKLRELIEGGNINGPISKNIWK